MHATESVPGVMVALVGVGEAPEAVLAFELLLLLLRKKLFLIAAITEGRLFLSEFERGLERKCIRSVYEQ